MEDKDWGIWKITFVDVNEVKGLEMRLSWVGSKIIGKYPYRDRRCQHMLIISQLLLRSIGPSGWGLPLCKQVPDHSVTVIFPESVQKSIKTYLPWPNGGARYGKEGLRH